jgi:hypothetical protein
MTTFWQKWMNQDTAIPFDPSMHLANKSADESRVIFEGSNLQQGDKNLHEQGWVFVSRIKRRGTNIFPGDIQLVRCGREGILNKKNINSIRIYLHAVRDG